uniref:Uncharacterized protein n=1 Tax=Ananas comosus var. bracteatus TaxID=296719 RepID=A0A6V7PGR0_ANACO|nr:unnamed protein product [Ananas comosus var. bracteatus]
MPITRSQSAGADNAANFEEVEIRYLRIQRGGGGRQQTEAARRQEARMKRLQDLFLQQAAASRETQGPTPPAPVVDVAPRAPSPAPVLRVRCLRPYPRRRFGGTTCAEAPVRAAFPTLVEGAERDRLMERLNEFRRCSPRVFDGEKRAVYRYGSDGCTGTAIDFGRFSANPRLGLGVFADGVPVRGPCTGTQCRFLSSLNCRGFFAIVAFYIATHAPRALPELGTSKRKVRELSIPPHSFSLILLGFLEINHLFLLIFGFWRLFHHWSLGLELVGGEILGLEGFEPCWRLLREPSTQGEARDRGKGIASG